MRNSYQSLTAIFLELYDIWYSIINSLFLLLAETVPVFRNFPGGLYQSLINNVPYISLMVYNNADVIY